MDHSGAAAAQKMQSVIGDINERIARLAIALRVPLSNNQDVINAIQLLQNPEVAQERRHLADRRSAERRAASPDRRASYQRSELRGLLVLRYGVELRMAENMGASVTEAIMEGAATTLEKHGFEPGAGGAQLHREHLKH